MSDILIGLTETNSQDTNEIIKNEIILDFNNKGYEIQEKDKKLIVTTDSLKVNISVIPTEVTFTLNRVAKIENLLKKRETKLDFLISKKFIWNPNNVSYDYFYNQNLKKYLPNKSLS